MLFKGAPPPGDDWVITYEDFLELGGDVSDEILDARIADVEPEDVAAIVYTSGTTGVPKGAVLTHDNITFTAQSVFGSAKIYPDDTALVFLPLAHIFARTCVFTALFSGCNATFARAIDTIGEDFKIARPHWFPSVPRIYEKVHAKIISGAEAKGGVALKLFNWACGVGDRVSDHLLAKEPIPFAPDPVRAGDKTRLFQGPGRPRRSGSLVHQRRRTPGPIHRQVLPRRRRAHPRGDRDDREHLLHQRQPGGQLPLRLGRAHRARDRAEDRRRRRGALPRPQRHARVLQDARRDRRDPHRGRVAAHRRSR